MRRLSQSICIGLFAILVNTAWAKPGPLKVFVLAGQSNMQGHANISTLDSLADDPKTAAMLAEMRDPDGKPRIVNRVWISSLGCGGDQYSDRLEKTGPLTAGFGASESEIGPEFTFGIYMAKHLGEPVLIIKTSWGGRSLHTDFRPPGAGLESINDYTLKMWKMRGQDVNAETATVQNNGGVFYRHMIDHVHKVLADIRRVKPDYDPRQGYKLAGFVWFQGWNDMVDGWAYPDNMKSGGYDEYARLLAQFIRDVRKDLSAPRMPFVIGVMGVDGIKVDAKPPQSNFREAQRAPALLPEFRGSVTAINTAAFWAEDLEALQQRSERVHQRVDDAEKKAPSRTDADREEALKKAIAAEFSLDELKRLKGISNGGYHYLGAARILAPIGKSFADAISGLLKRPSSR